MSGERQPGFPWLGYGLGLAAIIVFTLLPVIVLALANAGAAPEPVGLSDLMASMGVLGWLLLAPFPIGAMAMFGWLVVLAVHLLLHRRRRDKTGIGI